MPRNFNCLETEKANAHGALDFTGYAQEFLRRNQRYRSDFSALGRNDLRSVRAIRMAADWGLMYPCDPDRQACCNPAVWLPELAPAVLILEPASVQAETNTLEHITRQWKILLDSSHERGRHIYFATPGGIQRLWLPDSSSNVSLVCKVPLGSDFEARAEALLALQSASANPPIGRRSRRLIPSRFQHHRLNLMLKTLDCLADSGTGSPVRDIARLVTFPHTRFASSAEWKGSSERRQTQRLIAQACSLADGGYKALLRGELSSQGC